MSKAYDYDAAIGNGADEGEIWEMIRGFAFTLVKKYDPQDWDDLMQECYLGIHRALQSYDPSKGNFPGYCKTWMLQKIRLYFRHGSIMGAAMWEKAQRIKLFQNSFYLENGELPTDDEIRAACGISVKDFDRIKEGMEADRTLSMEAEAAGTDGAMLSEIVPDGRDLVEEQEEEVDADILRRIVRDALSELPQRERKVIRMHYGMDGGVGASFKEIGESAGISGQAIQQIEKRAVGKLRNGRQGEALKSYFDNYLSRYATINGLDTPEYWDKLRMHLECYMRIVLNEREREVMRMRYGLDGGKRLTFKQIGEAFGVCTQRASTIEKKARQKLIKKNTEFRAFFDHYLIQHSAYAGTGRTAFQQRGGSVQERLVIGALDQFKER